MKTYRQQTGSFEVKEVDEENRTFEADVGAMGNIDRGDDIIEPGAFTKTIREKVPTGKVKLLDHHNKDSMQDLLGRVIEASEVAVSGQEASHALRALHKVSRRPEVESLLKDIEDGIADAMSVGFKPVKVEFELKDGVDAEDLSPKIAWYHGKGIRRIKEAEWWESSLVIWGMNPEASPLPNTVKSLFDKLEKMEESQLEKASDKDVLFLMKSLRDTLRDAEVDASILEHDALSNVASRLGGVIEGLDKDADVDTFHTSGLAQVFDRFREQKSDVENTPELIEFFGEEIGELDGVEVEEVECDECGKSTGSIIASEVEEDGHMKSVCPSCVAGDTDTEDNKSDDTEESSEMITINGTEVSAKAVERYIAVTGGFDSNSENHAGKFMKALIDGMEENSSDVIDELAENADVDREIVENDIEGDETPATERLEEYAGVLDVESEIIIEFAQTSNESVDSADDPETLLREAGIDLTHEGTLKSLHDYISSKMEELEEDGTSQDAGDTDPDEPGSEKGNDSDDGDSDEHLEEKDAVDEEAQEAAGDMLEEIKSIDI